MRWLKFVLVAASVAGIVGVLRLASIGSAAIAATLLLLDVVVVARVGGFMPALSAAILGAGAYSYFFLPPEGFWIEKPEDWVGFVTFLGTAIIVGELASRAERRAAEADTSRREIERLYRELQAAFERTSEAEAARRSEALKAALLDALRHNLRTPLTAIKAGVTALIGAGRLRDSQLPPEDQLELLHVINEESDRLNRFIEGLSTADPSEPSLPAAVRAVHLDEIVRASLIRADTLIRDHRMRVDFPASLPCVAVDAAAMSEVIYILIDNASKYAPDGTTISVTADASTERLVRLSVRDEGPGIPDELRERVFEKFFRIPSRDPDDGRRGGAGLGLSIARRLVEAQAGRIWIVPGSRNGPRGTEVVLELPIAVEATEVEKPPAVVA